MLDPKKNMVHVPRMENRIKLWDSGNIFKRIIKRSKSFNHDPQVSKYTKNVYSKFGLTIQLNQMNSMDPFVSCEWTNFSADDIQHVITKAAKPSSFWTSQCQYLGRLEAAYQR